MENVSASNATNRIDKDKTLAIDKIIICVFFFVIVMITIFGNVLVLVAIGVEKRLQTLFNHYIINLAVTDLGVAVTAMSFYTLDVTLGYWPFGEVMCALWIFCDYGMTFVSVFTLIAISVDRFWSVTWSLHYRKHHTRKKCLLIIAFIWVFMILLWLPPCVVDRVKNATPGVCIWEPSLNQEFVVVIAVIGHHGSFVILMFCYIRVLLFMRRRKIKPLSLRSEFRGGATITNNDLDTSFEVTDGASTSVVSIVQTLPEPQKQNFLRPPPMIGTQSTITENGMTKEVKRMNGERERRVFVTLTYIIIGYVICWLPFHIVFDVSSIAPDKVPNTAFSITFWMTYLNSTINPFLYNFSSNEFRQAFMKVLRCKHLQKTSRT